MTNFFKPVAAMILSTAVLATTATANAAPLASNVDLMKNIEFSQQDLASAEGVNSIHNRVIGAAEEICTPRGSSRFDLGLQRDIRNCVADTVDQAFENSNVEALSSYHQALPETAKHRKNSRAFTSNVSIE